MEKSIDWQPTCNVILQTTNRDPTTTPPFKGNLTKLVTKGGLLAKLKHWINSKVEGSHTQPLHKNYCELFFEKIGGTAPHELDTSTPPHLNLDLQVCLPILVGNRAIVEGVIESKGNTGRESILLCATRLYRQLWIWRCTLHRDVTSAFGFAIMACPIQGQITCSLLELQVPRAKKDGLGCKLPLRVQTVRAPLSDGNGMIQSLLGGFLAAIPDNGPWTASPVPFMSAGAAMTMPHKLHEANKAAIEIIPTTTGSLVLRCCSLSAVQNLLLTTDGDSYHGSSDLHLFGRDDNFCESAWYVKCKTPACFGPFWDTAATAISRTRDRLLTALKTHKFSSPEEIRISQSWLAMHPFDVIVRPHFQITVVRDCGEPFRGQLNFAAFVAAFHELVITTLLFQKMTESVHGDIHKNNVMLCTSPTSSSRLVLIDWDEALPKKPCHRLAPTVEEALRYPANLVDFPEAYTKQQFLHLFDHLLLEEYYDNKTAQRWATSEQKDPEQITVSKVNERFRGLLTFLTPDL